jgi:hypothetical protein
MIENFKIKINDAYEKKNRPEAEIKNENKKQKTN